MKNLTSVLYFLARNLILSIFQGNCHWRQRRLGSNAKAIVGGTSSILKVSKTCYSSSHPYLTVSIHIARALFLWQLRFAKMHLLSSKHSRAAGQTKLRASWYFEKFKVKSLQDSTSSYYIIFYFSLYSDANKCHNHCTRTWLRIV